MSGAEAEPNPQGDRPEGDVHEDAEEDLRAVSVAELERVASSHDAPMLERLFEHYLDREITDETFPDLNAGISVFANTDVLTLLAWLANLRDPRKEVEALGLSPEAAALARRLLAL